MVYGHGDDLYRYGEKIRYNFSSNIVSGHDHSELMKELAKMGKEIGQYPEPEALSLERRLGDLFSTGERCVVVTNGATEAIYILAHLCRDGRSLILSPTFREYQDACRLYGHEVEFYTDINAIWEGSDMVWICNPNNPTGKIIPPDRIISLADKWRETIFVIDQAYADYGIGSVISPEEVLRHPNIVILGSMTKRFSIPGLRIGYAVASEAIADRMRGLKMPWSVNTIAIRAGHYLLDNSAEYPIDAISLHSEISAIREKLSFLGITSEETECNFALFHLPESCGTAHHLKEFLVDNYGILIRDASNFEGLDDRYFRIAAQTGEENDLLVSAIKKYMEIWRS